MEKLIFCTLYDSYYMDKGIALYLSLERVAEEFLLYVFCFDDKSYEVLKQSNYLHMKAIHYSEFETPELIDIKKVRSKAEYCWTCTPIVIEHVLKQYGESACTYLDSDLYFYADPQILFQEIALNHADVVITKHRFKDNRYGRKLEKRNGTYCVQFNYFKNTDAAAKVLTWWKEKCLEWCYDIPEPDRMGDQKYLNQFTKLFSGVHELEYLGGGVAPWNLEQYRLETRNGNHIILQDKSGEKFQLVFYHFQNIRYLSQYIVNIKSQTKSKKLKYVIYIPYLKEIEEIRSSLRQEYGFSFEPKKLKRSSNCLVGFLQKHFAALKIQSVSDIIDLRKLDKYWL